MYISPPKKYYVSTSILCLFAFSTLFFTRTVDALGAPGLVNFVHFALVPGAFIFALLKTRTKDKEQIQSVQLLLLALILFFIANLISALVNQAGFINVVFNFLLPGEPFIMLLAITSIPLSISRVKQIKNWVLIFCLYNLCLAYIQYYVVGVPGPDFVYGAFFSIAGATFSSIVSLTFGLYYLISEKDAPVWIRVSILIAALWQIIISDAKLVLGSFLVGLVLFALSKVSLESIKYLILGILMIFGFFWALEHIAFLEHYAAFLKPELLFDLNSEFYLAKFKTFSVIPTYYDSGLDYLVGIGPGHGVGRMGGWMLAKYGNLLGPLGATHPYPTLADDIMLEAALESRNVIGTAMYGPLFSWAGIWSDLGIVGLGSYLLIWLVVWNRYCLHDLSKYLVMTTFAIGMFPATLEEPSSMLFTTFVIGLWWHEGKNEAAQLKRQKYTALWELSQRQNALTKEELK